MTEGCRVGLIVLAAGAAARFGAPKQLARFAGQRMLQRVLAEGHSSPCHPIVLVLGAHAAQIAADVDLSGIQVVQNDEWREGVASSVRCGVRAVMTDPPLSAVIITLADLPCIGANDYVYLIDAHRRQRTMLVAARHDGGVGVPALFPRDTWSGLQRLRGDTGARSLLAQHRARTVSVRIPAAQDDVDTREGLLRLSRRQR
jgi:molybdenum cofactor cytidylyltransferase